MLGKQSITEFHPQPYKSFQCLPEEWIPGFQPFLNLSYVSSHYEEPLGIVTMGYQEFESKRQMTSE